MNVPTALALAFLNATVAEITTKAQPCAVAARVVKRVESDHKYGTTRVPDVSVRARKKTRDKIKNEQRVVV